MSQIKIHMWCPACVFGPKDNFIWFNGKLSKPLKKKLIRVLQMYVKMVTNNRVCNVLIFHFSYEANLKNTTTLLCVRLNLRDLFSLNADLLNDW